MIVTSYVVGFSSFCVHALLILIWLRLFKVEPVIIHILNSFLIHIVTIAYVILFQPGMPYWQCAAVYWFCVLAYLYGFSAFYTSVSIAILYQLWAKPEHVLMTSEIYEKYVKGSFMERVDMLVRSGQADCSEGVYTVTQAGRKSANMMRSIQKKLFGIENSGLYFIEK